MNIHFQALIEQKLRKDLESFGLPSPGDFKFDWSEIVGEGDEVEYLGDQLESASGLLLKNESGTIIGEGWIKQRHQRSAAGLVVAMKRILRDTRNPFKLARLNALGAFTEMLVGRGATETIDFYHDSRFNPGTSIKSSVFKVTNVAR